MVVSLFSPVKNVYQGHTFRSAGYVVILSAAGIETAYLCFVNLKVAKDHEDGYWVVDPEIYAKDFSRFGSTTMGRDGMAAFLSTHRCNQLCERLIGGKPKGLDRTSKRDVSRRSIKDSAKGWSLSSFQSVRELESIDTGSSDRASPKVLKAVKCDFIPIWRALKRNKKV